MNVLVLNAGSSSLKYKLIVVDESGAKPAETLAHGNVEASNGSMDEAAATATAKCRELGCNIDAVGHRLVHGGSEYRQPIVVTDDVLNRLKNLRELDPLHNPPEIGLIEASKKSLPNAPQVAVFDTGFHATLPEVAWRYALPKGWVDALHLRRYGFHGISFQYVAGRLAEMLGGTIPKRVIVCHLGSGASVCALLDGASVDTSMGMTPLEGLVMATRCGDVDPGLLMYALREKKIGLEELDDLLNHKSGLAGLAEASGGDARKLEAAISDPEAAFALHSFAYHVRKYIGSYAAVLSGLDALVFTGGIGEGSAQLRHAVCSDFSFLGIALDDQVNQTLPAEHDGTRISQSGSSAGVWVIPTNEELEIARQTAHLLEIQQT